MSATSAAAIVIQGLGTRYTFDGVTSVSHSLSLKIVTDSDSSEAADTVSNARNEPDVVTLSVVASDAHVPVAGWAAQTLRSLIQIKENRLPCQVITSLRTYDNMLLSALSVLQDDTCPDGWTGTLTFTRVEPSVAGAAVWTEDRSSAPRSAGTSAVKSAGSASGSVLQQILREAGISLHG